MKYRSKEIVGAIQWTGDNLKDVKSFVGYIMTVDQHRDGILYFRGQKVEKDSCFLKNPDCSLPEYSLHIMSKEDFERLYEPYIQPEPELLPCPFCGRELSTSANICSKTEHGTGWILITYFVLCDCGVSGVRAQSEERAIELWNQRG